MVFTETKNNGFLDLNHLLISYDGMMFVKHILERGKKGERGGGGVCMNIHNDMASLHSIGCCCKVLCFGYLKPAAGACTVKYKVCDF